MDQIMYCDMQALWKEQQAICYPERYMVDTSGGWECRYCILPHIYIAQLKYRVHSKVEDGAVVYVKPGCPEWWEIEEWQL